MAWSDKQKKEHSKRMKAMWAKKKHDEPYPYVTAQDSVDQFYGPSVCDMIKENSYSSGPQFDMVNRPLETQVGGGHYKDMAIQPVEYIYKNGIGYFEGCVIKYVSRWKKKNGIEDLRKAIHFIELLVDMEESRERAEA